MISIDKIFKSINIDNIELDYMKHEFYSEEHYLDFSLYTGKEYIIGDLFKKGFKNEGYFLDLRSDNIKFIITINSSYYHFMHDIIGQILSLIIRHPDIEIILDTSLLPKKDLDYASYFVPIDYFISKLVDNNIKHKIIKISDYNSCVINNFYADMQTSEMSFAPLTYDFFNQYVKNKNVKPFRKVYLSRKVIETRINEPETNRIDNHEQIENLFKELGFEVINAEYFLNFEEQINYFNEVKTIASLTSSGIANAIFMQPGQTIIEIFTPLILGNDLKKKDQQIHFYYHFLAAAKNHKYISFNNLNKKIYSLKETIYNDQNLLRFLKNE